jgi:hypothetical protein
LGAWPSRAGEVTVWINSARPDWVDLRNFSKLSRPFADADIEEIAIKSAVRKYFIEPCSLEK